MIRTFLLLLLAGFAAFGQSFILELNTAAPALDQFRAGSHRTAAREFAAAQTRVRESQAFAIRAVENAGGRVLHRLDTVANALIVEAVDPKAAARLRSIPGVKAVHPVVEGKAAMDRVLGIHKIQQVWDSLPGGGDTAGAGIKVGIVDTGVDIRHSGLNDDAMPVPDGFPKFSALNEELDRPALDTFGNKKVIVMRSYENLVDRTVTSRSTARDANGHGTGVAFAAVGKKIAGPSGPISGVAPKAHLGVYRITAAEEGSSNSAATFAALDDAVKDGMDVINLSFGFQPVADDFNEDVTRRIYDAGVIFISAGGNNGPGLQSIAWPASSPWVIAAGASGNNRLVTRATINAPGISSILGYNGSASRARGKFTGPLRDSAALSNELACDPFPADSLKDSIALILRGSCTFVVKLNNAAAAGAIAAIVYNPEQIESAITMTQDANNIPATWINFDPGQVLKNALRSAGGDLTVSLDFAPATNPAVMSIFSSRGPTPGRLAIKPDVPAVGESFITASPISCCNDQSTISPGLTLTQGTSLSSPVIAGAAALLKQARPGLKIDEYRSLLVNTATAMPLADEGNRAAIPHEIGAGRLDVSRARLATLTANPLSISFGGGGKDRSSTKRIRFTNIGGEADTFALSVEPLGDSQAAVLSAGSLNLDSKAAGEVELSFTGSGLRAGHHHGYVIAKGSKSDIEIRVPYWYGVSSTDPASIAVVLDPASPTAALGRATLTFRVTDSSGQALDDARPEIEPITPGGTVESIDPDSRANGLFVARVRVGRTAATVYQFRIKAGAATETFAIATP